MIKIAVSLSGMPRNIEQCYQNTLEFFDIDDAQVDFFIHCWSNSWYPSRVRSKSRTPETGESYDQDELEKTISNIYNPKTIKVENQLTNKDLLESIENIKQAVIHRNDFDDLPKWLRTAVGSNLDSLFLSTPYHLAQTYSISKTAEMIEEDEESYDLVVRYRFDNYIELRDKEWRTKMFHDMVNLIKHAKTKIISGSPRDYLFVSWITVMGEEGYEDKNLIWIGDKIFACSKAKFSDFKLYFDTQVNKIIHFDPKKMNCRHIGVLLMPENTMNDMCTGKSFFVHSSGYLNKLSLISYRDYHLDLEQTFETLQREYTAREKNNHDSADGIVLGL
jgi:hypothetical protein